MKKSATSFLLTSFLHFGACSICGRYCTAQAFIFAGIALVFAVRGIALADCKDAGPALIQHLGMSDMLLICHTEDPSDMLHFCLLLVVTSGPREEN